MTRVRGMCASQPLELSSDRLKKKKSISTESSKRTPETAREMPHTTSTAPSPLLSGQPARHIGMTTELEPLLMEYLPLDEHNEGMLSPTQRVRKMGRDGTFMRIVDHSHAEALSMSLDAVETLVAPYGSMLVDKFFEKIHPVFPVLMEEPFRHAYRTRTGLSPLLLAAVYVLASKYLDFDPRSRTARKPDVQRLESTAMKLLSESLLRPDLVTIQAGLLIMQRSSLASSALNGQLVTAAFELGLHQDCAGWDLSVEEKGLRRRLAWALYMQDKWSALVHGRPSQMPTNNWTVRDLVEEDFTGALASSRWRGVDSTIGHGTLLFCQHIALTAILADILDTFYTLRAMEQFEAAGHNRTRYILERAKPIQIRLRDWFTNLPPEMKMDWPSTSSYGDELSEETASNGALHIAYFATEITLHRCIIRSLSPETADNYLSHICRSAAKTRLISAMDFVNRLRPAHLQAFWPAASRTNFALIGSFGALLLATAPTREEAEFYRLRLSEYRWTLSVSVKNARFLRSAIESLDIAMGLARNVPEKPGIEELMASKDASCRGGSRGPPGSGPGPAVDLEGTTGTGGGTATATAGSGTVVSVSGLASPVTSASDMSEDEYA